MPTIVDFSHFAGQWLDVFETLALQASFFGLIIWIAGRLLPFFPAGWFKILYIIGLLRFLLPLPELTPTVNLPLLPLGGYSVGGSLITGTITTQDAPNLPLILFGLWIIGVVLMSGGTLRAQLLLHKLFKQARPVVLPAPLHPHKHRSLRCYLSDSNHGPLISGWRRPRLLLPAHWERLSPAHQRLILVHEIHHWESADPVWLLLSRIVRIVHFYNPLVHLLEKAFIDSLEKSCDDKTLRELSLKRTEYGAALLDIASTSAPGLALPFSHTHNKLKKRIVYHLKRKEQSMRIPLVLFSLFMLTSFILSTGFSQSITEKNYVDFFDLDVKPNLLHKESPDYPENMRKSGVEGRVMLKVYIDEKGDVMKSEVVRSVNKELDAAARKAAVKLKFTPGEKDGKKVPCIMAVPFEFRLNK